MQYNSGVGRFARILLAAMLIVSASGVFSLVVDEPCTVFELTSEAADEGACPPTCLTCGCCAQVLEPQVLAVVFTPENPVLEGVAVLPRIPKTEPIEILHVPKPLFA